MPGKHGEDEVASSPVPDRTPLAPGKSGLADRDHSRNGRAGSNSSTDQFPDADSNKSGDMTGSSTGRITPFQQMISSCTGAMLVSLAVTPLDVVKIRLQTQGKATAPRGHFTYCNSIRKRLTFIPVTPLDVIKIRLQTQQKPFQRGQCFLYCNGLMDHICVCVNGTTKQPWYKMPGQFSGTFDAFIKITRQEGAAALWSGLPPTLLMAVPATVVYFTTYDQLKYAMGFCEGQREKLWIPAFAGSIARVFAASVISPIELIRTKMQSASLTYKDIGTAIQISVTHGGLRSLWMGLGPTILRDVPFSGIYWTGYESMKSYRCGELKGELTFAETFVAGACAGTIAGILTLPFDVVKTHRQVELGEAKLTERPKPKSTLHWMKSIYHSKGPSGLFAGIVPRLVKVTPACAIMISSYEYGKSFFKAYNSGKLSDK